MSDTESVRRDIDHWIIVENQQHVSEAIQIGESSKSEVAFLSTTPQVWYEIKNRGEPIINLSDYVPHREINRIDSEGIKIGDDFCCYVDWLLQERMPSLPTKFRPFDTLKMQFNSTLTTLYRKYRQLWSFFHIERPKVLIHWDPQCQPFGSGTELYRRRSSFFWNDTESLVTKLLSADDIVWPTEFSVYSKETENKDDESAPPLRERLKNLVRAGIGRNRINWYRKLDRKFRFLVGDKHPLLVLEQNPYVWEFANSSAASDCPIDIWLQLDEDPVSTSTARQIPIGEIDESSRMLSDSEIKHLLDKAVKQTRINELPEGVSEILLDRLKRYTTRYFDTLVMLYERAERYFAIRQPSAVLCGPNDSATTQIVTQAAKNSSVPTVSLQHGGTYGYIENEPIVRNEVKNDIFCSFGEGVSEQINEYAENRGFDIETVSIGISGLRSKWNTVPVRYNDSTESLSVPDTMRNSGDNLTVLYVSSGMNGKEELGPNVWYDDTEYVRHQFEVADMLCSIDNIDPIFKLHYKNAVPNPLDTYLATNDGLDVTIIRNQPLTEVLPDADVVLLDRPSTTLLESLLFNKYIIYIDIGWFRWYPEARELLNDSINCIEKTPGWESQLLETFRGLIEKPSEQDASEFIKQYCNPDYTPGKLLDTILEK